MLHCGSEGGEGRVFVGSGLENAVGFLAAAKQLAEELNPLGTTERGVLHIVGALDYWHAKICEHSVSGILERR